MEQLITLAIGILFAWETAMLRLSIASASWIRTTGHVLKVQVIDDNDEGTATYSIRIQYRYRARGMQFESSRLSYQPTSGLLFSDALTMIQGVRAGTEIDVYYNPRNPRQAVLVRGADRNGVIGVIVIGMIFAYLLWQLIGAA
jgi:hypothetical protein